MRRTLTLVAIIGAFASWPVALPQAQRGPTISADLRAPRAPGDRVRVIVQGEDSALRTLRGRLRGVLRRDLGGALFATADSAESGVLNLLGLSNPLASVPANRLVWGEVAGWSSSYYLVWGNTVQSPSGQYLVWGNTDYTGSSYLVWGNTFATGEGGPRR